MVYIVGMRARPPLCEGEILMFFLGKYPFALREG